MTIKEALENLDVFFDYLNESGCFSKLEKESRKIASSFFMSDNNN